MGHVSTIQHKALFDMINFSSAIFNAQGAGFAIIDADDHQILFANPKLCSLSGFSAEMLIGKECHHLLCPSQKGACPISDLGQSMDNSERILLCADGRKVPIIKTVSQIELHEKKYLLESILDITVQNDIREMLSSTNEVLKTEIKKRSEVQNKLEILAHYDHLTGLANRFLFIEQLNHAVLSAKRSGQKVAVMFLDLDGFKMINDATRHAIGDEILIAVSKRLTRVVRKCDIVCRIAGDEFVIMFENVENDDEIRGLMEKVISSFKQPFSIKEQDFFVTTSLGVAVFPEDATNAEDLIQNADIAMCRAKEQGKNQGLRCTRIMKQNTLEYMNFSNQLYTALANNQLTLYYQPQIRCCNDGDRVVGMEALLRWNHPQYGAIAPAKFIPIAEKTGLIHSIGTFALRTACAQNKAWQDQGLPRVPVAVNLSALQFNNRNLVSNVTAILEETGLSARYLELEITESVIMRDLHSVIETLNAFRNMGISISVDDFGTEYSSLQYLKQLPIDKLKIAMPFVQGLAVNPKDEAITEAIILLAQKMKLRVIAEGVDTEKQLAFLKQSNCQEMQGYYFYKALPPDEMEVVLKNERK